ncbi:MAG: hypothetical protein ACRC9R_07960 [Enterovibrio sp.]
MSLLTAVTNVANEAGYTVESNITASTETTTKQLRTLANRINQEMADQYPWPVMYASGSITLVDGQAQYALPASFSQYLYDSFWNSSTRWRVLGPMTEQEYAETRGYGVNTNIFTSFQFRGVSNDQLLIYPTPTAGTAGQTIIFEYIADRSVRPTTWLTGTAYAAGAYTFYNGNYYSTVAGGLSGITPPTHTSGSASDGGVTWVYYSGAYKEFLADSDLTIFNQRTLEMGMMERFAEIHGLDSVQPRFQVQLNEDFSRQNPGKVIYAGDYARGTMFARSNVVMFGSWI